MKIGILVDPYGEKNPSGLGRWALEIVRHLVAQHAGDSYTLYVKEIPEAGPGALGDYAAVQSLHKKSLWLSGGSKLDSRQDVYLFVNPLMPLMFFPKKSTVVAHDFAYLEMRNHGISSMIRSLILFILQGITFSKATKILCISEQTRTSLMKHFGVRKERTEVITLGPVDLGTIIEPVDVAQDFFLFAGVLKDRKNVAGIIRAFALFVQQNPQFPLYELCIAGRTGGAYYNSLDALTNELGVQHRVRFLGYVTDGQMLYLYKHAIALVFPSFIEGFGMPVLEAMSVGLPVITSNQGALSEVAGNAALLVDPADPASIAQAISRISLESGLQEKLRMLGYARVATFSWDITAKQVRDAIGTL